MKQTLSKYIKIFKQNKRDFIIIILISLAVLLLYSGVVQQGLCQLKEILATGAENISKNIESVMTAITFILAIFIGWGAWEKKWEEKLPKRLTVHFKYEDRYVFTFCKALLPEKTDIRAWAQQIGKQMNGNNNLDFYPFIDRIEPVIIENRYKYYELTFYLMNDKNKDSLDKAISYKFWWDNDDNDYKKNKEIIYNGIVSKPFDQYTDFFVNINDGNKNDIFNEFVKVFNNDIKGKEKTLDVKELDIKDIIIKTNAN